jgi:ribosomal protein S25
VLHHREALCTGLLNSLKKQEAVCRKRAKGHKHSASVRMEEVVGAAREAITRSQRQSVRYLAQQTGVSNSTACNICRDYLFSYETQLSQQLREDGIAKGYAFMVRCVALLEEHPGV